MKLRELKLKDALFMLEWMHDESVVRDLQTNFAAKQLEDCETFIRMSSGSADNVHLAIVDENDIYMGTVSLKHIQKDTAEFGIAIRTVAMGKGYSKYAMDKILEYAFEERRLNTVYWCVSPSNKRAVRFYEKSGYQRVCMKGQNIVGYTREQIESYYWYVVAPI